MRYFVDSLGKYLGGTDGDALSTHEVPHAPEDARQPWNGSGYDVPVVSADDRRKEIYTRLDEIDQLSIRALRSKGVGRGKPEDDSTLSTLDDEADALRLELAELL